MNKNIPSPVSLATSIFRRMSLWCCVLGTTVCGWSVDGLREAEEPPRPAIPKVNPTRQLDSYWPINASQRGWRLVRAADRTQRVMTITNTKVDDTTFRLWFTDKPGQAPGQYDIEQFRYCENPGAEPWLWLDKYINYNEITKARSEHAVQSSKILFTPEGSPTQDLIANGTYARCGSRGQPYLRFNQNGKSYRIQVWGTIGEDENSRFRWRWYWDATVYPEEEIDNGCRDSKTKTTVKAIKVKEAWWDNFIVTVGAWTAPGGGTLAKDGLPTGESVRPFRTVWHAEGRLPYFVIGTPEGAPNWCASQIWEVPHKTAADPTSQKAEQGAAPKP
ncbi:MAG: hypothetical protein WCO56_11750 [Verrucomicrobiota bacterium]